MKSTFFANINLTRRSADDEKKSDMSSVKFDKWMKDINCLSKYSHAANLRRECYCALCPVVKLKDISQNGTTPWMCLSGCLGDEIFMTSSCASEKPIAICQAVHRKCNMLQVKKWLRNKMVAESDVFSAEVCDCNTKQRRVDLKPIRTNYTTIGIDLTSELGKRNIVNGGHHYDPYKGSDMCLPVFYERFCNHSLVTENVSSRLRTHSAHFPVVYQRNRKIADYDVHKYHFTKQQRYKFCKLVDLKLKHNVMPSVVRIPVLSQMNLLMLSQKKLRMCRVSLRRLSQPKKVKQDVNKRFKNCFVCLNQLPTHLVTKYSSTCVPRASSSGHSVPNHVKSCTVSLCELPRHMIR